MQSDVQRFHVYVCVGVRLRARVRMRVCIHAIEFNVLHLRRTIWNITDLITSETILREQDDSCRVNCCSEQITEN